MSLDQATKQLIEKDLLKFLTLDTRYDIKSIAIRYILETTGTKEGIDFISEGDTFLEAIMSLTSDTEVDISRDSYLALINLSSEETIAYRLMHSSDGVHFMLNLLNKIVKSEFALADEASSIIANVTRLPGCAKLIAEKILAEEATVTLEKIVNALCQVNFNKKATLHYLALILSNLTQVPAIRKTIMDKDRCIIQKLLPFTEYSESVKRRGGIIGALKNCCFEYDYHSWLLSDDVDILSRLLLPLAGGDELDDDEMEKLPVDLQYLPLDKKREPDHEIRGMLIEAITQLCSTKNGRMIVKDKNAYVILRELHKWEKNPAAKLACQKLCELLISDEPDEGMEDLHTVDVPAHLAEKFEKLDEDLLKDMTEELQEEEKQATSEQKQLL
uniref:Protein HGH1 homolog n=1 Tax=Arion vulgaris TaxID=1028688 RepID=A0A0B6Z7H2_9EUPU